MAEFASAVIALVAAAHSSTVTITHILRTIKHADQEFSDYIQEIEHFHACVREMEERLLGAQSMTLTSFSRLREHGLPVLVRARDVLVKIDRLLRRILGSSIETRNDMTQFRKRTWLRHHSQMKRLIEDLRNVRSMIQTTFALQQADGAAVIHNYRGATVVLVGDVPPGIAIHRVHSVVSDGADAELPDLIEPSGPNLALWQAPILKAARKKDLSSIRDVMCSRSGSIHDVDEFCLNVMHLTAYRPGNLLDAGNIRLHADMMRLFTNAGYDAEDSVEGGTGTTLEILLQILLLQRARLGLENDFASLDALQCFCNASGLNARDIWDTFKARLWKVPLMEALLRLDPDSPSFGELVADYASKGNLQEMVNMGIWERLDPYFICSTPYMLVANTWHEPLQLLCEFGVSLDSKVSYLDVRDQNLLHALAGCAYWRGPTLDAFLATENVLLATGLDPNTQDSNGETFLHNLILLPYGTAPLDLLHHQSRTAVDWLAKDNRGDTAREKYQHYWKLECIHASAVAGPLQGPWNHGDGESALVALGPKDLSSGFDTLLARSLQGSEQRERPSLASRCTRHGRPHLHVVSFDRRDTDSSMSAQWRDHHEDIINFLYEHEQDQLSRDHCSAGSRVTEAAPEDGEWEAPRMPGSFE